MANTIKTQCPSCQSIYPIPSEQLANNEAKARCPNCQTVFFINHNRYIDNTVSVDAPIASVGTPADSSNYSSSQPSESHPQSPSGKNLPSSDPLTSQSPVFDTSTTGINGSDFDLTTDNSELSLEPRTEKINNSDTLGINANTNPDVNDANNDIKTDTNNSTLNSPSLTLSLQDDTQDSIIDSVDDMSQWLDQQTDAIIKEKQGQPSIDGHHITTDKNTHSLVGQSPASQRAHKANKEGSEWIDELVDQDSTSTSNQVKNRSDNSEDLTDLLTSYGVTAEKKEIKKETNQLEKMRDRVLSNSPTAQQVASKKSPVTSVLWLCGCLLLVALLLVQYTIFNINSLVKNPNHRGKLITACNILSCRLPGADLDSLQVTHVNHRLSQVGSADDMDIMAALVNLSQDSQLYPNLKISIQGADGVIAEFVAQPKDYLTVQQDQIAANQAKLFMFTVKMNHSQVSAVDIQPFY